MPQIRATLIAVLVLLFASPFARAEGYAPRTDHWEYAIAPALWAPGLNGDVKVNGSKSDIDLSPGDIFGDVRFAGLAHFEAKKGDWAFIGEPTYVDASQSGVKVKYLLTDLLAAYRLSKSWEIGGGLRHVSMDNSAQNSGSKSESWDDLVVGGRYTAKLSQKWSFIGHLDASGFDIGSSSKLTVNLAALFFWDFGRSQSLFAGYRYLDIDFDDGSKFTYDVRQQGPLVGINFHFPRR